MDIKSKDRTSYSGQLALLNDGELLSLRAVLEVEMRKRGVAFSVGEIGEMLAIEFFNKTAGHPNLQPAPIGTKNVDALSRNGDRYSIKTVWKGKKTGTIYPDPVNPDKQLFEQLLIVRLDDELKLHSIHEFDWKQFLKARRWDKRMSAWYVPYTNRSLGFGNLILDRIV